MKCPKCGSKSIVKRCPPDLYASIKPEGEPSEKQIGAFQKEYYFCNDCKYKWDVENNNIKNETQ